MAKRRQTTGVPSRRRKEERSTESTSGRFGFGKPLSEYKTRAEREAEIQRRVVLGVGIAIAIVIVLVAVALIYENIISPGRTVATVDGTSITANDFRDRVRFERLVIIEKINSAADKLAQEQGLSEVDAANQAAGSDPELSALVPELSNNDQIGLRVLNDMIEDVLVREEAESRGITVTQEDIDKQVEQLLGFDSEANAIALDPERTAEAEPTNTSTPTPFVSPTPQPTETPDAESTAEATEEPTVIPTVSSARTRTPEHDQQVFENNLEQFYERASREADFSRSQVNAYFELQALREKLAEEVLDEDVITEVWVDARRIVVTTEEEAQQVLDALNAGEPFSDLARAVSLDTNSKSRGGEMGSLPYDGAEPFTPEFLETQFGLDPNYIEALSEGEAGELIGPIPANLEDGGSGFQIIQIISREDRDLQDEQIALKRQDLLNEWLDELRDSRSDVIDTSDNWPSLVPTGPFYAPRG